MVDKRKTIELLPGHLRSETLEKVFSATVDQLFQPDSVEFVTGYVGQKPAWYDVTKDFYVSEPTKNRTDYQLSPTYVSRDYQTGRITNAMFYEDLLGQLRFQGAIVNDHNRLFDQEYYSWSPPIDIDKFVNFTNYYWLPGGPDAIELLGTTDLENDAVGKASYTYTGQVRYVSTGEIDTVSLVLSSGIKIKATADRSPDLNAKSFIVEGVGRSIVLVDGGDLLNPGWNLSPWDIASWGGDDTVNIKQYVTISRASQDQNQWSDSNRWFHIDIINTSKTTSSDPYSQQARRPIIEFDRDIRLWNYGWVSRGVVDLVDSVTSDFLGTIVGSSSFSIDQVPLRDGMRVLSIADANAGVNNRIYVVSGAAAGSIELTLVTDGRPDGIPRYGDRLACVYGSFQNLNLWYDGTRWTSSGQQKSYSSPPLFELFDIDGNSMADPSVYRSSNFTGSRVFSYQIDESFGPDPELGFGAKLDQFGDYVFNNNLATDVISYVSDGQPTQYVGDLFAKLGETYSNTWNIAPDASRQYIVNEFVADGVNMTFSIDQEPAVRGTTGLPTIFATVITVNGTATEAKLGIDYTVSGRQVVFAAPPRAGARVQIKSWNNLPASTVTGYYEIPKNLSANPNNETVATLSRSQLLAQFSQIIGNQFGSTGDPIGINNYRDTLQNKGLGLSILQHRAPLLKLAGLNTIRLTDVLVNTPPTDPMQAMRYAQNSYQRFYNRFLQALFNISKKQGYTAGSSSTACEPYMIGQWINAALQQINLGKTQDSPWANSGPGQLPGAYCSMQSTNPTYVPATATRLGLAPAFRPVVYMDQDYTTPRMVIQTHDGARIVMVNESGEQLGSMLHGQLSTTNPDELTDPVAAAWLQFEINLFNGLPLPYSNPEAELVFDVRTVVPGKWRSSDYTRNEVLSIQRGSFEKWTVTNQVEYKANTGYDTADQFSYNYRSVTDRQGRPVPGHWRGIYRWFYDTDRPHTHPWEMLGFSQMPSWWEAEYGPRPYTRGNTALWSDLRDGLIRQGPRAGSHAAWARSGLMECIPVDAQGNLLPPYQAGTVATIPDVYSSKGEWQFGDGGPVESVWINSQEFGFVEAQTGYLLKPARFIEYTWDTLRTKKIYSGANDSQQWVYVDTNSRRSSQEFYVHRERPRTLSTGVTIPNESDLDYFGSCGCQHWIAEYVVSQGLDVTNLLGNLIRGGNVQLAYRAAGYLNSQSLRATVDSFGELGFASSIIPSENVNAYLYRSTSVGESVYSGVIVEQVKGGWRVYGYDQIGQVFNIIPSNPNGAKNTVVVANQRAIEYKSGLATIEKVLYGTVFATRQAVYDFIISYGRWLEQQGWVFESYSEDSNEILNWSQSAKEFLFWSQGTWENGTFITLSPAAGTIKYMQEFGTVQYVNGAVSGSYPIVDRRGAPIQPQNVLVNRLDGGISVRTTNTQGIFGLRLYRTTMEHAVFFDNETAFSDVIYTPLYDLRQERIKLYAYRSNGWNGTVDAPGYIITQNPNTGNWSMTENFESSVRSFEKFFNIEQPKNYDVINPTTGAIRQETSKIGAVDRTDISNLAKHLIGYQSRDYLQNLLLEESTQFEFYQGFIRQKGTKSTIDKLLRNTAIIPVNSRFEYYEEWLIRVGSYGATSLNSVIEYRLPQSRFSSDPQWIRLFSDGDSDYRGDDVIEIVPRDPLLVTPPESYSDKIFTLRPTYKIDPATDLPTAGYAMLGETKWMVTNKSELLGLYAAKKITTDPISVGDKIWQFITDTGSWMVWKLCFALGQIETSTPSSVSGDPTTISTTTEHGLLDGDICVIYGVSGVSLIDGTYVISGVGPRSFQIPITTYEQGFGGTILVYRPMRFADLFERNSGEPPGGWTDGDLAYVDNGGLVPSAWTVYKRVSGAWLPYRQQERRINSQLVESSKLFDAVTGDQISNLNYHDPIQGRISGRADSEITFKTDYDPAKYNKGNSGGFAISEGEAWSSAQLGTVWWDLSAVRYIDYGQGDDRYRIQHWGKIAPGTSVDIYEWIRSPIPPADWASAVAEGESIEDNGRSYVPSGSVRNPSNANWCEVQERTPSGTIATVYYFWVKNSAMPPAIPSRELTTANIANLVSSPSMDDRPWYAAISQRSIIIGNVQRLLNGNNIIQRINYSSVDNSQNSYGQWELIRESDPQSPVSAGVWSKLKDSLTTFDGLGNDVPDYHLNDLQRYGNTVRPRTTWFINREAASKVFIDTFNASLAASITPLVDDPTMTGWQVYFEAAEQPQEGTYDFRVGDLARRDDLVGAIGIGDKVLVDPIVETGNLWTIWEYLGQGGWLLVRKQAYNTANYWRYVDWYLTGYDSTMVPSVIVETIDDLDTIDPTGTGMLVKVLDNGSNKWQWYAWAGQWVLVGQQDASIEVLPSVYTWSANNGGFDGAPFESQLFDGTAAIELGFIIDGIKEAVYPEQDSIEINQLLFSAINYVISEQGQIDWLIKTSDIVLKGFEQPLRPYPVLQQDNVDSIIGFINEAKPYHAKIREFVASKSYTDTAGIGAVDFDRPPGYESLPTDTQPSMGTAERSYLDTATAWYDNYLTNPQLVRTLSTTLVFDRISTPALRQGWGYSWDLYGWDGVQGQNFGAVERIERYYEPTEGMIPKIIEDLMSGVMYQGTRLSGLGLNIEVGWGLAPWGGSVGWDADLAAIEQYLDQIIQGGSIPDYESMVGDGIRTSFNLSKDTVNPNSMVVWCDGQIKVYGVDWIVPTYATAVDVISGGSGYSQGDVIELIAGSGLVQARFRVTSVVSGSITGVEISGRGSYTTVTRGPYETRYPSTSPGAGTGAVISADWACRSITFSIPPASSNTPNIYILRLGTTFAAAPTNDADTIYEGNQFIQPFVDDNHPEELFPMRPRDSIMMDVRSEPAGGRPVVMSRVYLTDGLQDQFDLGVSPQSNQSVWAYLDSTPLICGPGGDYVINFITGRMVFISTPAAGGVLNITTIGAGGGSRSLRRAYSVSPGLDYVAGDVLETDTEIGVQQAEIEVTALKVVEFSINNGGTGFVAGDTLIIDPTEAGETPQLQTVIRVTDVDLTGAMLTAELAQAGVWPNTVPDPVWRVSRRNAVISQPDIGLTWGVSSADVSGLSPGLFARKPPQPMPTTTVSPANSATFNATYTGQLATFTYTGDGVTELFPIRAVDPLDQSFFMVTVDGVETTPAGLIGTDINITPAPEYGSTVIIHQFENSRFSRVIETVIDVVDPLVLTYPLLQAPFSTLPPYISTLVRRNGELVEPPTMQQFAGNGIESTFRLTIDLTGATSTQVYVDQILSIDHSIVDDVLIFPSAVTSGADVQVIVAKASDNYVLSSGSIEFSSSIVAFGDQFVVTTHSEDMDYEYHMEKFAASGSNVYGLAKEIYDHATVRVWHDGVQLVPLRDFSIERIPETEGWDLLAWDEIGWQSIRPASDVIRIAVPTTGVIVVSYMVGLPTRPSIAWRTLISGESTSTIALDAARQTVLISNVYSTSTEIEISNAAAISHPADGEMSYVYINDELVGFAEIQVIPNMAHPNRAFLRGLRRNTKGTSGTPKFEYNVQFYDGDSQNLYFATQAAGQAISETVWVDGALQIFGTDYVFEENPPSEDPGRYVRFVIQPPTWGSKNVKIVSLNTDGSLTNLSHVAGSTVIDAGEHVTLPDGYSWEPAPRGLQYSESNQSAFLLAHKSSA